MLFLLFIVPINSQSKDCSDIKLSDKIEELRILVARNLPQKSILLADSLLRVYSNFDLLECEAALWILHHKADAYELEQMLTRSIGYYNEILPKALANDYYELLAETYISLARSHEMAGRGLDCKRNLDEAHKIILTHDLGRILARLSYRSSSYYRIYENRIDTAILLAKQAVDLGREYSHLRAITDGYLLLGMLTSDIEERLQYFINGRDNNFELQAYHAAMVFNLSIAGLYKDMGKLDMAEKTVRKSFVYERLLREESGQVGFYNYLGNTKAHTILAEIFEKKGKKDSVEYHRRKVVAYAPFIMEAKNQQKISQLEIKNAVEIEKYKGEILDEKLSYSRYFSAIISLGLVSFFGFTFYLFSSRNKIQSQNFEIVESNKKLDSFAKKQVMLLSEVHHRVKNNLQNIISLLELQGLKANSTEEQSNLKGVASKIFSIALIHELLYQDGEFQYINIQQYFSDLSKHYKSFAGNTNQIVFDIDGGNIYLNIETMIPLGLICAELITNSIKFTSQSKVLKIRIDVTKNAEQDYRFLFSDNGDGFPDEVIDGDKSGMGSLIITSMSRQMQADLQYRNDNGAVTELTFKEKEVSKI